VLGKICGTPNEHNWFDIRIKWVLGDGNKIRFPRLYSISLCKDKVISEMEEWVNIGNSEAYN